MAHVSRSVLSVCRRANTSQEFASLFVKEVAKETGSQFCLWTNQDTRAMSTLEDLPGEFIAQHGLRNEWLAAMLELASSTAGSGPHIIIRPVPTGEVISCAAVPVRIRSEVCGVLAVGNRPAGYDPSHLRRLEGMGSAAMLRWEYLRHAESMGLEPVGPDMLMAELAHDLRQPLSSIELLAALLEITLPANETRAREHLQEIRLHVNTVDCILSKRVGGPPASLAQPEGTGRGATAEPDSARFSFRNDTISSVTH